MKVRVGAQQAATALNYLAGRRAGSLPRVGRKARRARTILRVGGRGGKDADRGQ